MGVILIGLGLYIIIRGITRVEKPKRIPIDAETYEVEPASKRKVEGGGVILIGPVPIVFGTSGKYVVIAVLLTIVLMILVFAMVVGWR